MLFPTIPTRCIQHKPLRLPLYPTHILSSSVCCNHLWLNTRNMLQVCTYNTMHNAYNGSYSVW
jgi:hypothetical protein